LTALRWNPQRDDTTRKIDESKAEEDRCWIEQRCNRDETRYTERLGQSQRW